MLIRSVCVAVCLLFTVLPAQAKEKLILDAAAQADALRGAKVEIWRVESSGERKLAHKGGADKALRGEVELPDGAYEIYIEDQQTGLIHRLDNQGKGFKIGKGKPSTVDTTEFVQRIQEIKNKDEQERPAKAEALKQHKGKRSVFAVEEPAGDTAAAATADSAVGAPVGAPGEPEVHAPGELLVKFQPATTLADRYRLMLEIEGESRSKLQALAVYRVKLSDQADLPAIIRTYANDPRLKYMEMNMVVSVPEPVEEGR